MRFVYALVIAALASPAAAQGGLTPAQRAAVMAGVRQTLIDPPSARFGPMRSFREGNALTVCGTVNAKNNFGGYTGPRPFLGQLVTSGGKQRYVRLDPKERWPTPCHGVDD